MANDQNILIVSHPELAERLSANPAVHFGGVTYNNFLTYVTEEFQKCQCEYHHWLIGASANVFATALLSLDGTISPYETSAAKIVNMAAGAKWQA